MFLLVLLVIVGVFLGYLVNENFLVPNDTSVESLFQLVGTNPQYQLMAALLLAFVVLAVVIGFQYANRNDEVRLLKTRNRTLQDELQEAQTEFDDSDGENEVVEKLDEVVELLKERQGMSYRFDPNEDPEDRLVAFESVLRSIENGLALVRRNTDDTKFKDDLKEFEARVTTLRAMHTEMTAREESFTDLQHKAEGLERSVTELFNRLDLEGVERLVSNLRTFIQERQTGLERAKEMSAELSKLTGRLTTIDEQTRDMVAGETSLLEQVRRAERMLGQIKPRVVQLEGKPSDSQRNVAAVPSINERIVKLSQEIGTIETSVDKLDPDTGVERLRGLMTRIGALHVQLTGRDVPPAEKPILSVVSVAAE
jgi:DNA repair ATPase RecN